MVTLHPPMPSWRLNHQIKPEVLSQLRQTLWCIPILDDDRFIPILFHHRNPPPHLHGRFSFMSETLNTPRTIPLWETFYKPSSSSSLSSAPSETTPLLDSDPNHAAEDYGEVVCLISLGTGLDGHPNRAQGGVAATILDEVAGFVGYMHKTPGRPIVTAYMNTNYRRVLPTPASVLARASLDGRRSGGRKMIVKARLEDGLGNVFVEAEVLFIEVEPGRL